MFSKYHIQDTSSTMKLPLILWMAIASIMVKDIHSAPPPQNEVVEKPTETNDSLGGSLNPEVGTKNKQTRPLKVLPEATNLPSKAIGFPNEAFKTLNSTLNITGVNNTGPLKTPTDDNMNSTIKGYTVTDYLFFNPEPFAYKIFMTKVIEALRLFNLLIKMDPFVMKLTKTYLVANNTDFDDDRSNETSGEVIKPQEQAVETNTESTPNLGELLVDIQKEGQNDKFMKNNNLIPVPQTENETEKLLPHLETTVIPTTEDDKQKVDEDDIKKTKVAPKGFFGKIGSAVSGFFHSVTSWFK